MDNFDYFEYHSFEDYQSWLGYPLFINIFKYILTKKIWTKNFRKFKLLNCSKTGLLIDRDHGHPESSKLILPKPTVTLHQSPSWAHQQKAAISMS